MGESLKSCMLGDLIKDFLKQDYLRCIGNSKCHFNVRYHSDTYSILYSDKSKISIVYTVKDNRVKIKCIFVDEKEVILEKSDMERVEQSVRDWLDITVYQHLDSKRDGGMWWGFIKDVAIPIFCIAGGITAILIIMGRYIQ